MNSMAKRWLSVILSIAVLTAMCLSTVGTVQVYGAETDSAVKIKAPAVVITGTGVITEGKYTKENLGREQAYSLDDLKTIAGVQENPADHQYVYSLLNTRQTKSIYKVEGIRLDTLLEHAGTAVDFARNRVSFTAADSYTVVFDPNRTQPGTIDKPDFTTGLDEERYFFPNISNGSEEGKAAVPAVIAWAKGGKKGSLAEPESVQEYGNDYVSLAVGQLSPADYNNPLWNGETSSLVINIGGVLPDTVIINGKGYTRAELMAKESAVRVYTCGGKKESAKGIFLTQFLTAYGDRDLITITCKDGSKAGPFTKKELAEKKYMLAYEKGESAGTLSGILDTKGSTTGVLRLYADQKNPIQFVSGITVKKAPPVAPKAPVSVKVTKKNYNSITIRWSKSVNASGYLIYRYDTKMKKYRQIKKITTGSTLSCVNTGLKTGTRYTYRIRAYTTKNGQTSYSGYSIARSATPTLTKPVISKVTAGKKCALVKWKRVAGANGYKIYRATSKNGKYKCIRTIRKGSTVSYKNTKLKKDRKYYYKVRAYRTVDKKNIYSSYSSAKYTTIRK